LPGNTSSLYYKDYREPMRDNLNTFSPGSSSINNVLFVKDI
jgi:hypothetical protein